MGTENQKNSVLDSIFNQYEKNKSGGGDYEKVDLTKYFTDKLQDGINSDERTFRILPSKDGGSPFVEAYWHEMEIGGKWTKIYCKNHNDGERCPLCEVDEALRGTGDKNDKELAKQYKPKKFYIVKVIHRENEDEGVKFYRFKHYYNNDGVMDKLHPIFKKRGDITDPRTGRDLTMTISRDQNKKSKVTSIQVEDPSILTEDPDKANLWFNDISTWKNVYKSKDNDYMEIVAKLQKPVWDKENKKWTSEEEYKNRESVTLDDEIKISKDELSKKIDKKTEPKSKDKFKLITYEDTESSDEDGGDKPVVETKTAPVKLKKTKDLPF